jgi:hypothetical protein
LLAFDFDQEGLDDDSLVTATNAGRLNQIANTLHFALSRAQRRSGSVSASRAGVTLRTLGEV